MRGALEKGRKIFANQKQGWPDINIIEYLAGKLCIAAQIICDAMARPPSHSLIIMIIEGSG